MTVAFTAPDAPAKAQEPPAPPSAVPLRMTGTRLRRDAGEPLLPLERETFRRTFFPDVSAATWSDYRWQLANRVTSLKDLARFLDLGPEEIAASPALPLAVTPYYLSLFDPRDPAHPLRRTMVPSRLESLASPGESADPLGEEADSPVRGLVHRYPDRALLLATGYCAAYCRYCTRSRLVGKGACSRGAARPEDLDAALDYIRRTPAIRDVVVSGGDPLTMPTAALERLLARLRAIDHVEVVRIGTKVPMVLPMRVTRELTRMLSRFHPLFVSVHCTHPQELTPEASLALGRLADAGIPLGSQTVLLAGINDDPQTMADLTRALMRNRVRPYYLYQCDQVPGTGHFRTPLSRGVEIVRSLRGHVSGYCVPHFVVDLPNGGGKTPVEPGYLLGADESSLSFVNYQGRVVAVPDSNPAALAATMRGRA